MHAIVKNNILSFPMHLQGVIMYMPVRKPTAAKWETGDIVQINMMAENLDLKPNYPTYSLQEAAMTDYRGVVLPHPDRGKVFVINALSSLMNDATDITDDKNFGLPLEPQVTVSVAVLGLTKTKPGHVHFKASKPVNAETLAKHWLIPVNCAARMVDRATQQGVPYCLHPTLSHHFLANDWDVF